METVDFMTLVEMPDNTRLEVTYYCKDNNLKGDEKKKFTQLYIQLHDCICFMKIAKSVVNNAEEMERIVHNKVISERGHLC
ncbi:MAG: hypothetical protein ACTHM5_18095 [Ginsengibacter sp.]